MSDDTPSRTTPARRLLAVIDRRSSEQDNALVAKASLSFIRRAEGVLDRLDGVAATLEKVAKTELALMERLVPIVDDLGELVRHSLDEVRERRGLPARGDRAGRVIDAEAVSERDE